MGFGIGVRGSGSGSGFGVGVRARVWVRIRVGVGARGRVCEGEGSIRLATLATIGPRITAAPALPCDAPLAMKPYDMSLTPPTCLGPVVRLEIRGRNRLGLGVRVRVRVDPAHHRRHEQLVVAALRQWQRIILQADLVRGEVRIRWG